MQEDVRKALDAIIEAAEVATRALLAAREGGVPAPDDAPALEAMPEGEFIPCMPKQLSKRLLLKAARTAIAHNPANAVRVVGASAALADFRPLPPEHIAVLTQRYWGPAQRELTVSFMESTPADLRDRLLSHMNAWSTRCGISFRWTQSGGQVRISRGGGGYWSFLGPDILHIPAGRQTMNLQGFTMSTPESEYRRVVRHETGHTLGFPHEHMRRELVARLVPEKVIAYFARHQGWDRQTVIQQVLTALEDAEITAPGLEPTPADQDSLMCYQLSGEMTTDGQPIRGGTDINESDFAFAGRVYPKVGGTDDGGEDVDWLLDT